MKAWEKLAADYMKKAHLYRLGELPTEQSHSSTVHLSEWAKSDLKKAYRVLKELDLHALSAIQEKIGQINQLGESVRSCLEEGGRIFICGCGATGRLALTLEYLWREKFPGDERVVAFMAGGDIALVHSLEGFEDFPEYGARHLEELGFRQGDLLISSTEGGETPYVIGATQRACEISNRSHYYLFCNPKELLNQIVERSRKVFENSKIISQEYFVGSMALAGSTRMQASTVLELVIGLSLLYDNESERRMHLDRFVDLVKSAQFDRLDSLTELEAETYAQGNVVLYKPRDFAISVFTDTTERSPTFSLVPFKPYGGGQEHRDHSLCYISLPNAKTAESGWTQMLNRAPRSLNWSDVNGQTMENYLAGFDFGVNAEKHRKEALGGRKQMDFRIWKERQEIFFGLEQLEVSYQVTGLSPLFQHLFVKILLNQHSTLVMGRLDRYRGNLMTWVSPTNGKLIDRAKRYISQLLIWDHNKELSDDVIVQEIFKQLEKLAPGDSVVLAVLKSLSLKN